MRTGILCAGLVLAAGAASANAVDFIASTDRVAYTGTVSTFDTIDDAINNANATGVYGIPNRATASPFDTPSRDAGIYFLNNFDDGNGVSSENFFATAWWYTTDTNHTRYSGWGNPNNTNTGFVQLADDDGSTTGSKTASFGDFDGTFWTSFTLQANGSFATHADDFARLWAAPTVGGPADETYGLMYSWNLDITFTGLEGVESGGGVIEAIDHPEGVTGTFTAVFVNEGSNSALNGFYRADFTFSMDSWAYGQDESLVGGPIDGSHFVVLPAPFSASVFALAGLGAMRRRR